MVLRSSLLAATAATAAATSIDIWSSTKDGSFTYKIGNDTFYAPSTPAATTYFDNAELCNACQVKPLTVFRTDGAGLTSKTLDAIAGKYAGIDDVWSEEYLQSGALYLSSTSQLSLDHSAASWMASYGIDTLIVTDNLDVSACDLTGIRMLQLSEFLDLQPGPYTWSTACDGTATIRETYKLYRDNYEAFLFGVTPVPESTAYAAADISIPSYQDAWIPVPSRLYSMHDSRPFSGLRIALKDIYDLEGVQTGGGSRSYAEVYPVANATAVAMRTLIDLGAVVVGKTKTSQFAHGADPWAWLDIQYPWNPRGDGYLTAASSSSGSAVAIAAYDWLDLALGSDTRGSVRRPAALVGSYGLRPTWQSMNLTGIIPLATEMDTAGFFARDPDLFVQIANLWYDDSPVPVNGSFTSLPGTILYPLDYFPLATTGAQAVFDSFIEVMERDFGMSRRAINISATLQSAPGLSPSIKNATAFQLASNTLAEWVSYQEVGIPLAEAWNDTFSGAGYPPLDPNPRAAFARSLNRTEDDYDQAVAIKNEFRDFFLANILRSDPGTCSESIMIVDIGTGGLPSYREQALNELEGATSLSATAFPGQGPTIPNNYLASMAGCPEIGIPMGQVPYASYISLQEEMLPVNVDLIAAPGCDSMLLEIVSGLAEAGVAKTVKTGKTAF